ncbi:MAG: hypothetical protein U0133_20275 [Gemmatimonadales bacterium]
MDSEILRLFLSLVLNYLAPALLVTAGVVGVLQATGLGRAVLALGRGRQDEREMLEAALHELQEMRGTLLETTERLDVMERRLAHERASGFLPPSDATRPAPERIATPH